MNQHVFDLARNYHRAGRLREAEQLYRQILARQPDHADALHLLGVIACQVDRHEAAVELIRRAVGARDQFPEAHNDLGVALKATGRLDEAIAMYRRAIALKPDYAQAYNNLADALRDKGEFEEAIALYREAIALRPGDFETCNQLGIVLTRQGRSVEAVAAFRLALAIAPNHADSHNNLGNALQSERDLEQAIGAFRQAIDLKPVFPEAYNNLGNALSSNGQLDEAVDAYRRAISLKPNFPEALSNLGNAMKNRDQLEDAICSYREAIALDPNFAEAHCNLGAALRDTGQLKDAISACRRAIALKPGYPEALSNLGAVLSDDGHADEAIAACRQAVALRPGYAEALSNLAVALSSQGRLDESIAACRKAIDLKPGHSFAHYNLATSLLMKGDFAEGWEHYEWRRRMQKLPSNLCFLESQWDGSDAGNRTLLLHSEQGFGDTIQFIRYVRLTAKRCGRIIVQSQPELHRLFRSIPQVSQQLAPGEPRMPFDCHCPLLCLAKVLGTTLETIPNSVPYLAAGPEEIDRWRQRLGECGCVGAGIPTGAPCDTLLPPHSDTSLDVGLAWAGHPAHKNDRNRSMKLSDMAPLARIPGIRFFSLQIGEAAKEAPPPGMNLIDLTQDLHDFSDTAALIANLDLVICVDTAVAHLAGAMGTPVWTLLPHVPDWRWLLDREDSPWYPTMRLFRQQSKGDWSGVVARVVTALEVKVKSPSPASNVRNIN